MNELIPEIPTEEEDLGDFSTHSKLSNIPKNVSKLNNF